jgi:hypothetical protein
MAEPADLLAGHLVDLEYLFFESADEHHHPQSVAFGLAVPGRGLAYGRLLIDFVGHGHLQTPLTQRFVDLLRRLTGYAIRSSAAKV